MVKSNNIILLTGAGFTRNFGGFLGAEMWSKILSHPLVQMQEKIRTELLNPVTPSALTDYETVYTNILSRRPEFAVVEKNAVKEAVKSAYEDLDNVIKNYDNAGYYKIDIDNDHGLQAFLNWLFPSSDKIQERQFFFTLNQDLWIERKTDRDTQHTFKIVLPGVDLSPWADEISECRSIQRESFITLPVEAGINKEEIPSGNLYIKLHGSYGWLSAQEGQEDAMVIGSNKKKEVDKEPLLKWYSQLFEEAVCEGDKHLLIIGYGFRDEHINRILFNGIKKGLKLYVINPTDPSRFLSELRDHCRDGTGDGRPEHIWNAIYGYFPYRLSQIFSTEHANDQENVFLQEIKEVLYSGYK